MTNLDDIFDNSKNGANLENRAVKILKEFGWSVKENQPYLDLKTDKQRELDIIASKELIIGENSLWIDSPEKLEIRLFIDCKNIPQKLGLYTRVKNEEMILDSLLQKRTYNNIYGGSRRDLKNFFDTVKNHRYFGVGKMAYKSTNNDEKNIGIQGINQVLHAMHSDIHRTRETYNIDYPVIIIDDIKQLGLESENGEREHPSNNMFYGIDYIVDKQKKHFIIDIVGLDLLKLFLTEISIEIDGLGKPICNKLAEESKENRYRENEGESILNIRF